MNQLLNLEVDYRDAQLILALLRMHGFDSKNHRPVNEDLPMPEDFDHYDCSNLEASIAAQMDEPAPSDGPDDERLWPGEDMDGDAASALASAGFGTDEDYEHGSCLGDE